MAANRRQPEQDMIALGVRQPWAELIVRGLKTIEVRSLNTNVRGRIYVYAAQQLADSQLACQAGERYELDLDALPRGAIVGTVDLHATSRAGPDDAAAACVPPELLIGRYGWHLRAAERFGEPLAVRFLPYGIWFYPFKRRNTR